MMLGMLQRRASALAAPPSINTTCISPWLAIAAPCHAAQTYSTSSSNNIQYDDESAWEDKLQRARIQPLEFYESHAAQREYFYYVSSRGGLYLEDTVPKNIATSLKSPKFLSFFTQQLRKNEGKHAKSYPWISPCGKEMNYVSAALTPVVFTALEGTAESAACTLSVNNAFDVKFQPDQLAMDEAGRLYHSTAERQTRTGKYGLVASAVAVQLAPHIELVDDDVGSWAEAAERGTPVARFSWNDREYDICACTAGMGVLS